MSIVDSVSPEAWLPNKMPHHRQKKLPHHETVREQVASVLAQDAQNTEQPLHSFLRQAIAHDAEDLDSLQDDDELLDRVLRTATPSQLHTELALAPTVLGQLRQLLAKLNPDDLKELQPLAASYGRALRSVNGHARRAAQAATANPIEQREMRRFIRQELLQWHHQKLLERLEECVQEGVTPTRVRSSQLLLESRSGYFTFLATLERLFPNRRQQLDVRTVAGFDTRVIDSTANQHDTLSVAKLVGYGFSEARIPYFLRELASGHLEMIELRQAPELKGPTEPVGCIGVFQVNDQWEVIDWWSRHSGDYSLSSSCLQTVTKLHPDRRLMYSCNWHSSLPTSRIGGISFGVERSEDPPVAYISSLLLNEQEMARCPSKLPEHRQEVIDACGKTKEKPNEFVPCVIGGQQHWAIAVSVSTEEMRQSVISIRNGQPFELGYEFFAAVDAARTLSDPAPVLTWIEGGKRQTDRVLIFGPNPVDDLVLEQLKQAKTQYGDQLRQIHGASISANGD